MNSVCTRRGLFQALRVRTGALVAHLLESYAEPIQSFLGPLEGAASVPGKPIRPPGARPEPEFLWRCTRCDRCVEACPPLAIRKAGPEFGRWRQGTPILAPEENPCLLCSDLPCVSACPTGALSRPPLGKPAKIGSAVVDRGLCLLEKEQPCDLCQAHCPTAPKAITAKAGSGVRVDARSCTGCGVCAQECPADAIRIQACA